MTSLALVLLGLAIGMACTSSDETSFLGNADPANAGSAGFGGAAGLGGAAGPGGAPAVGGYGAGVGECATGGCQGYQAYTRATGTGFAHADGTTVHAVLRDDAVPQPQRQDGAIEQGQFVIDFPRSCVCVSGPGSSGGAALYVDVDADGACDPNVDEIFVWPVSSIDAKHLELELTPQSARCLDLAEDATLERYLVEAAQEVCPAVGSCFSFCGTSASAPGNTGAPLLCESTDAGSDASSEDASAIGD